MKRVLAGALILSLLGTSSLAQSRANPVREALDRARQQESQASQPQAQPAAPAAQAQPTARAPARTPQPAQRQQRPERQDVERGDRGARGGRGAPSGQQQSQPTAPTAGQRGGRSGRATGATQPEQQGARFGQRRGGDQIPSSGSVALPAQQSQTQSRGGDTPVRDALDRARREGAERRRDRPPLMRPDGRRDRDYRRPRYDEHRYPRHWRPSHRYRGSFYRPPIGFYFNVWSYNDRLPWGWYTPEYWIDDWWRYGLPMPPIGCEWVRVGRDVLLVDVFSGRVLQVVHNLFW